MADYKLSPYGFDLGRFAWLILRPNVTLQKPSGPHDECFPDSGLLEMRSAIDPELCDLAIKEASAFDSFRREKGCAIAGSNGRHFRVANLHVVSNAIRRIGLTDEFHRIASQFFGGTSTIYTSLYFKHGSQQAPHIDTPYFWTRPINNFVGVWVALEDIDESAGPLVYYAGSHRFFSNEEALRGVFESAGGNLERMFELMEREIESRCERRVALIRKGDAVIWHPGVLHGGQKATDSARTRYSTVFHFAPLGINVRDEKSFLKEFWNIPTYGVKREGGNFYCRASLPAAMV